MINLHNHTTWSDGGFSITELAEGARERGIRTLGVTDHFETDKCDTRLGRDTLLAYKDEARAAAADVGIRILTGAEIDLTNVAERMAILPHYEFPALELNRIDYVLFEYAGPLVTYTLPPNPWKRGDTGSEGHTWQLFLKYRRMLRVPVFLAHPRFDLCFDQPDVAVAKALETLNTGIELNGGMRNRVESKEQKVPHFMRREGIYREAARRGIPFLIGSDTHLELDELLDCQVALEYAREIGAEIAFADLEPQS